MKNVSLMDRRSAERIKQIIDEFCDGKQQVLADLSGLNKSNISAYLHLRFTPSSVTAAKIARPFGLNPVWIMGFDVPKYPTEIDLYSNAEGDIAQLVEAYNSLSNDNKSKLLEIARLYAISEKEGK